MSADQSASLDTGKLHTADFNKLSEEEQERVRSTESFLDALEANINSDLVSVPVFDMYGNITKETRLMSMSQAMQGVVRTPLGGNPLQVESEPKSGDSAHSEALCRFEEAKKGLADKHEAAHAVPMKAAPATSLEHLGLAFLADPPSQPSKTVKLQLSGPVKFGTTMNCHTYAITDHVVVLVTDSRVKGDIIDISLEDASVEATLVFDEQTKIEVYPPIPVILTYDIGVLRHFVFIRKHPAALLE
jgi:hypothetical protein